MQLDDNNVVIAEPHPNIAQRRRHAVRISDDADRTRADLSPVADAEWDPNPHRPASLSVISADRTAVVHMVTNDRELQIEIGDRMWRMPYSAHVRLVFDGPVVELFSDGGIFAAPIPVAGARTISVTHSQCTIYEL